MKKQWFIIIALVALGVFVILACGGDGDDDGDDDAATASFQLRMIDAPIDDAEAVNLTISSIAVRGEEPHQGDDDMNSGDDGPNYASWIELEIEPTTYDLLALQNNVFAVLAEEELPFGDYSEIRLILECDGDSGGEIVIDGETYPLKVPSGCQSGFKLKGDFTVQEGAETILVMDLDARKSITETGNGKYILNPVARFIQAEDAGNIIGEVEPIVDRTVVYAFENGSFTGNNFADAIQSTMPDQGAFTIAALPAGDYDIVAGAPGYETGIYVEALSLATGEDRTLDEPVELIPAD
ncbi:MAG: DUF4382 domain-containing protein [Candidatus Lernaella stagnicola]|nr:DUF4382 domain-containing protein [Candidatus Lernaella stagnicola]